MKRGDVVLVRFPHPSGLRGKKRPAVKFVVVPSNPGVLASEYANFMSKIERELRAAGDDHVLLVPALED